MPFSTLLFVAAFLPAYVAVVALSPRFARNIALLAVSLVFYAWGAPRFAGVVLALGVVDSLLARVIAARRGTGAGKALVALGVAVHLSVLAYFKYSNFAASILGVRWAAVALPIGVSFLTFEEISYVVDVWRGDARPARSTPTYLLFLTFFPHSIAGPIFRWKDLERQLEERSTSLDDMVAGLARFAWGLGKKVLIADAAAVTVDAAFGVAPGHATPLVAWAGAIAYAVQIYYDFSGYSDMAIGLARVAGFRLKENFDAPYSSASIAEFWTRWHISLSTWLRDYLYIPLGGNRHGERRTRLNVLAVFALSGLWHGAAWTFVVWGLYHGALATLERTRVGRAFHARVPRPLRVVVTFVLVVVGWVFFRAKSLGQAGELLAAMSGLGHAVDVEPLSMAELLPRRTLVVVVVALAFAVVRSLRVQRWSIALAPAVLGLSVIQIASTSFVPIIYFRF
jgi:alginate O-acetyltransferase complex protein AlgI